MSQTIKLKRGLEANRTTITPSTGEIIYTTDNTEVFIGDGSTAGGIELGYLNKRTGGTVANLTITGNLTVNGTTTTVNSNDVSIGDATILLNSDIDGVTAPSEDAGILIKRGTEADASLLWDETNDYWTVQGNRILDVTDSVITTVTGDTGSYVASNSSGAVTITGGTVLTTSVVGSTLTVNHDAVSRSDTFSAESPTNGGTFDVVDSVTTSTEGHITAVNLKTVTLPDVNKTYNISAEIVTGGANLRLIDSDLVADDVAFLGTTDRLTVSRTDVDTITMNIASTYIGQTSIVTLGTVTVGTWNANTITVPYGGTGLTSVAANALIYGNGTSSMGVTGVGAWDATNGVGQILSVDSNGTPTWTNTIDGGTF